MTTPSAGAMWPPVGCTVVLTWGTGSASVEVQHTDEEVLRAGRRCGAGLPEIGTPMQLEWSDARGLHQRSVRLQAVQGDRVELMANGTAEQAQRRQFYRARTTLAAVIRNGHGEIDGITLDLSEAGVRVRVADEPSRPLEDVTLDLVLDGTIVTLPGRVVRHIPTPRGPELGVAFDDLPAPTADVIRRQVFSAQLSARRQGSRP